ncbi:MAG: FkbM family methyltransferase [Candidatus Omnitrophica bacterium]|nr:FkbM family methyltransferase [Candidatus Omnitrophota bacterium]
MAREGRWRHAWHQLRWKAAQAMTPRRRVASRGLRFTLQCDNWITRARCVTYNTKEPETLDWLDRWMRDGDVFIDVGANIGVYTLYAARRHPNARVIAVEPEYANAHLLRDNVMENHLTNRVELYAVALGRRAGLSTLHLQDFTPGAALHSVSRGPMDRTKMGRPVIGREGIYVLPLDQFCEELGVWPHCMKLDVDGTELEILEGAPRTLRATTLRSLIMEPPPEEAARAACRALLEEAGLVREWHDPSGKSSNEVWVRRHVAGGIS